MSFGFRISDFVHLDTYSLTTQITKYTEGRGYEVFLMYFASGLVALMMTTLH